jgi:hypothetical protein
MKKKIVVSLLVLSFLEKILCMNGKEEPPVFEKDAYYVCIKFVNASVWPDIQNFIKQKGGKMDFLDPRAHLHQLAEQARIKMLEKYHIGSEGSESWNRVSEIMLFDQGKLERFLCGFGDMDFKSSVIDSVLDDIDTLMDEFTLDSLIQNSYVKNVIDLLDKCKVEPGRSVLLQHMLSK